MTTTNLYEQICSFPDKYENRDLEEYLAALYALVDQYKEQEMSPELFIQILSEAFTIPPTPFKKEWLNCNTPPHDNGNIRKFTNPIFKDNLDRTFYTNIQDIQFTLEVLKFQIAELHKMRDKQLKNEYRYFGITSETGHEWYNFDPFSNLECGARCLLNNSDNEDEDTEINWQTIGILLEDGRIYE
jgi:hypothetical protein